MKQSMITVNSLEERCAVYRVGNDQPIMLMQPSRVTLFGVGMVGTLDEFIQVDVNQNVEPPVVSAILVEGSPDNTVKLESEPSKMRMEYFASCALADLGIFQPGVIDVLRHTAAMTEK